ncbi:unnamed protein product [Phaedon cochleariae]|uniref:snRNA-activating protein complex subunit 1 n=1 Tax=Phaedon cochleariae TaxID=80249 RepID=A0A9P0DI91_PHACE|nr:unnamed protein product [Phaedon cochleariae]
MSKKTIKRERKSLIYHYDTEIASAFKVDCEEFLDEFESLQSFNYSDFVEIWQHKNFSYIFAGQNYALLLKEFCENCFYSVKKFIMFPRTLYSQIGAFYLLYGLYYKQPVRDWVKIRLTLDEYERIVELIQEMSNRDQLDAVYIFAKMKAENVFTYVAQRRQLGPEDRFVKCIQLYYNDTFTSSKTQSSIVKFDEICTSSELVRQLQSTNAEYQEMLKKYSDVYPGISTFTSTIIDDLEAARRKFNCGDPTPEDVSNKESVRETRQSIREKAMKNQHAVYRGSREVVTAVDDHAMEFSDISDSD